ncbi:hypothetical protein GCM10009665_56030 [Kitasatospora nipponensis]|uniref:HTH hxlR-type domain-containing protein n=1 Tax=Kitasatospora nipponensis TaxID=258049 RepID=A0ABN1WPB3_9ACTN
MDQTTSRWATLIISALIAGPHRFAHLHQRVGGISQKMLSQNLKALARAGRTTRVTGRSHGPVRERPAAVPAARAAEQEVPCTVGDPGRGGRDGGEVGGCDATGTAHQPSWTGTDGA